MTDEAIDAATLEELLATVGGDEAFVGELLASYLADSPTLVVAMRSAVDAGDAPALRRSAHMLKSTSASVGALRLSSLCREIEQAAASGDIRADLVDAAAAEHVRASEALAPRAGTA